jgi:ankyrin repeat protein/serine/threonine protein kinase
MRETIRMGENQNINENNNTIRIEDIQKTIRVDKDEKDIQNTIRMDNEDNKTIRIDSTQTLRIGDNQNIKTEEITNRKKTFLDYEITNYLDEKIGGEAESYIIKYNGSLAFAKFYKPNVKVNLDILNKIQRLSDEYDYFPKIYEIGKKENRVYEIQEYLDGGILRERLEKEKDNIKKSIKDFIKRVSEALHILHKEGIIHRDLKPENILYRGDKPVLTDFGATTFLDKELSRKATGIVGTNMYMAPEAVIMDFKTKKSIIGKEVDWWALGIIILEILDKNPFEGIDNASINYLIAKKPIPIQKKLDKEYQLLLKGLLTKDEKKRWGYKEITEWLEGKTPEIYFEESIHEEFEFEFLGNRYSPEELAAELIKKENFDNAVRYFDKEFFSEAKIKDEQNPYRAQLLDLFDLETPEEKVIFFSYTILKENNYEIPFSLYGIKITENYIISLFQKYVLKEDLNGIDKKIINLMEKGIFKKLINVYEKIYNKETLKIKKFLPQKLNRKKAQKLLNICSNYFDGNYELLKLLLKYIQIPSDCAVELLSNNKLYEIIKNNKLNKNSDAFIKGLVANGYIEDVKNLIKQPNKEYLKTAFEYNQINIAYYLLNLGTNPNIVFINKDYKGKLTPLIYAVCNNDIKFVKKLLDKGADPNFVPNRQNSPLIEAVLNENKEIINLLLKYNADINLISGRTFLRTPLHGAVVKENKEIIELLLEHNADPNIKSKGKLSRTPLQDAVSQGNKDIIKLLLKYNADVNAIGVGNNKGEEWTPLFQAVIKENKEIVELLLKHNADPDIRTKNLLRTPLHEAVIREKEEIVKLLLKYKADPNIAQKDGLTPIYSAVSNKNYKIIKLLINNGTKIDLNTVKYVQKSNDKKLKKAVFNKVINKTRIKNIIQFILVLFISIIVFYKVVLIHYYNKRQFVILNSIYKSIPISFRPVIVSMLPKKIQHNLLVLRRKR